MRYTFILSTLLFLLASCIRSEELSIPPKTKADTLIVGFEDSDTRIQLQEHKSVWTNGDQVSVFYRSNANSLWQYTGETGASTAQLTCVSEGTASATTSRIVLAYPYSDHYYLNTDSYKLEALLPATQHYAVDSYGIGDNLMVAQSQFTQFTLKNSCGWLKIDLTGNGEIIKSLKLRGNANEQLAGLVSVDTESAELITASALSSFDENSVGGVLVFDDAIYKELTLDCGEGVTLSKEATAFYFTLPPQLLAQGFTLDIVDSEGNTMSKSTTNEVVITRNHILPMAAFKFETERYYPKNNQVWYKLESSVLNKVEITGAPFGDAEVLSDSRYTTKVNGSNRSVRAIDCDRAVTTISPQALIHTTIATLYLPHSVTTVGAAAFYGSTSLTELHLGRGLQSLERGAFAECTSLSRIYCRAATPPALGEYVFMNQNSNNNVISYVQALIYVPEDSVEAYMAAPGWNKLADFIRPYDFVEGKEILVEKVGFNHRLLVIDHTGMNCGYCPIAMDRLHALANYSKAEFDFSSYYNEVTCHGGSFASNDPAYSLAAATVDAYYRRNNIVTGYPTIAINFNDGAVDRGDTDRAFVEYYMSDTFTTYRKTTGADVGIAASSSVDSSSLTIDIEVAAVKTNDYKVTAWVLENNISAPNQNGASSSLHRVYHHALRAIGGKYSKTNLTGDSLGTIEAGQKATKSFTISLDSGWNKSNLEVLVIVSAPKSNGDYEIVNTALCPANGLRDYEYIIYY